MRRRRDSAHCLLLVLLVLPVEVVPAAESAHCNLQFTAPADIMAETFYTDKAGSIIDSNVVKRNEQSLKLLDEAIYQVIVSSDEFVRSGTIGDARCATEKLSVFSRSNAMLGTMYSRQSRVERLWRATAVSISYFNTREFASSENRMSIDRWLTDLGTYVSQDFVLVSNNGRAWAALMLFAIGRSVGKQDFVNKALGYYDDVVRDIDQFGLLPKELARARKAAHYHNFTVGPLVEMMAMARTQGIVFEPAQGVNLSRLIRVVCKAVADTNADMPLTTGQDKLSIRDLWWLPFIDASLSPSLGCPQPIGVSRNTALGGDLTAIAEFWRKDAHK